MSELKMCSLRLESDSLDWADKLANNADYWTRSDIIRLAIWVGAKVITSRHLSELNRLRWEEEFREFDVALEDVLRTAGFTLENLKKVK